MVIGTLAIDEWAVIFGTARRAWAGCGIPPINGHCTHFIVFDVAL